MKKEELYQLLTRKEAYIVFLATKDTNVSALPTPLTDTENALYKLCSSVDVVKEVKVAKAVKTESSKKISAKVD